MSKPLIPWAAPEVQRQVPALRRDRHTTTDGEAIVAIAVANAGGLPSRCHVRRTFGLSRNPLSSTKTRWARRRAASFYPRPVLLLPPSDGGFVPLDGSAFRLLAAPAERSEHLPDVRRMIASPELVANQLGHPRQRPELCAIPGAEGALAQQCHQPPSLGRGQPWRPAGYRLGVQPAGARPLVGLAPAKDGTHGRPDLPGDGRQAPARLQQLNRASTAFLQLLGAARRSHEPSCRITLRIYAFFMQASIGSNSADSSSSPVNGRRRALRGCARASARATGGFSRRAENELSSVGHRAGPPSTRISTNALTLRNPWTQSRRLSLLSPPTDRRILVTARPRDRSASMLAWCPRDSSKTRRRAGGREPSSSAQR
jgi:hypothetical protein